MKNPIFIFTTAIALCFTSCSTENINSTENSTKNENINKRRVVINYDDNAVLCHTTDLIAGKNELAGTVSVYKEDNTFKLYYTTYDGWLIKSANLSIGTFGEHVFPTREDGKPKVGKFEYKSKHDEGVIQVEYTINGNDFDEKYWYAAHAIVIGANGTKTAWAKGDAFQNNNSDDNGGWFARNSGKNRAMTVTAYKSECPNN